jgi:hypothetical protein
VHGPEGFSPLLAGTERGFGRFPRLGVQGVERVLNENVFNFACGYVRFIQKRSRL